MRSISVEVLMYIVTVFLFYLYIRQELLRLWYWRYSSEFLENYTEIYLAVSDSSRIKFGHNKLTDLELHIR